MSQCSDLQTPTTHAHTHTRSRKYQYTYTRTHTRLYRASVPAEPDITERDILDRRGAPRRGASRARRRHRVVPPGVGGVEERLPPRVQAARRSGLGRDIDDRLDRVRRRRAVRAARLGDGDLHLGLPAGLGADDDPVHRRLRRLQGGRRGGRVARDVEGE